MKGDCSCRPSISSVRATAFANAGEKWDVSAQAVPCIIQVKVPSGVLSEAMRGDYVQRLHQAVSRSKEANDQRIVMTSIILDEVNDGLWGANGAIWYLADFTQAAGYRHLQGLTGK